MYTRVVILREFFGSSALATRQSARDLFDAIKFMDEQRIVLDFNGIESTSRSFFDELLSREPYFKMLSKEVSFDNLSIDLEKMVALVRNSDHQSMQYQTTGKATLVTI